MEDQYNSDDSKVYEKFVQFRDSFNHYTSYGKGSIFDYLYQRDQEATSQREDLVATFKYFWFREDNDMSKATRLQWLRQHYQIPVAKSQWKSTNEHKAYEDTNKEDIIADLLYEVIHLECIAIVNSSNTPYMLKVPLQELLWEIQDLKANKKLSKQTELALPRHYVATMVLAVLAYRDYPNRLEHLKTFDAFNKEISGHVRPFYRTLGIILIVFGLLILLSALAVALPTMSAYVAFASDYLIPYYITSAAVGYFSLALGIASIHTGQPDDLAYRATRVSFGVPKPQELPATAKAYDAKMFSNENKEGIVGATIDSDVRLAIGATSGSKWKVRI